MKSIIYGLCIFPLLILSASAQLTVIDTRFVLLTNNGTDYNVKVQIKTNSTTAQLGGANLVFRFDDSNLSYPLSPVSGTDYSFNNTFNNGLVYSSTITHNIRQNTNEHEISININYQPSTGFGTAIGTAWRDLVTVDFSTVNNNGSAGLEWDTLSFYSPVYGDTTTLAAGEWWFKGVWADLNTSPLPVELISFAAYDQDDHVHLHWETATELNNFGFEVERMEEGSEWQTVGFVQGHGTVHYPQVYDWHDRLQDLRMPLAQQRWLRYRLKQIDRDGTFEYSPVVEVAYGHVPENIGVSVYPNPSTDRAVASITLDEDAVATVRIHDMSGREVATLTNARLLQRGSHAFELPVVSLSNGMYALRVMTDRGVQVWPFVVRK